MNPDIKERWLAALRSGSYEQGKGHLRTKDDKYCCLGVLCDLAVKAGVVPKPALVGDETWLQPHYSYGHEQAGGTLPLEVVAWSGVEASGSIPGKAVFLTGLNDGDDYLGVREHDFREIADIIEKEL